MPDTLMDPKDLYRRTRSLGSSSRLKANLSRIILGKIESITRSEVASSESLPGTRLAIVCDRKTNARQVYGDWSRTVRRVFERISRGEVVTASQESLALRAKRLDEHSHTDAALDLIYGFIDSLMKGERFDELDALLMTLQADHFSADLLLGFLTASLPARSRLPARAGFLAAVEQSLRERGEYEEGLLAGL